MLTPWSVRSAFVCWSVLAVGSAAVCAQPVAERLVEADFSQGDFAALAWQAKGDWDVFTHPSEVANNPGPLARFAANKPDGALTKDFPQVKNPGKLSLGLDYGWGWGDAGQAADSVSLMLLDAGGNGYAFKIHRCHERWAVQWGKVTSGSGPKDMTWAPVAIDATHASVRSGGGLCRLTITRDADALWTIASRDWNQGAGASVRFTDDTTHAFSRLVLLGTQNFDEQLFNRIVLTASPGRGASATIATPAADFLSSLGIVTTFPDRGQPLDKTIEMIKYAGFRWVRGGVEGLSKDGPTTIETYLDLHRQTGAQVSWGLVSGGSDLEKLLGTARQLAKADALLAFEGNNEPNNWGVTYQNEQGGGRAASWLAVARLQRDLYEAVQRDPVLKKYPVWSISENGAEADNVGLQFLTIPQGADTLLPAGTRFADYANVHNYTYHPGSPDLADNKTWNAADPTSVCKVDGLYGNYGVTWAKHFPGYSEADLLTLPRVTTETGTTIGGAITEEIQALNVLTTYLDQFKRGWRYTSVYLLRDRTDEAGNQSFGLFKPDYAPRKAAVYLHNLTSILADDATAAIEPQGETGGPASAGQLLYSIAEQPATMHDLLLEKRDGTLLLIVWNERTSGADEVTVQLGGRRSGVKVYDPTVGVEPVQSPGAVDKLTLKLSDHPLVIAMAAK